MKKSRKSLTLEVRQSMSEMKKRGYSVREIGRELGICPSIVSRELRRNRPRGLMLLNSSSFSIGREMHKRAKDRLKCRKSGKRKARPAVTVYKHIAEKLSLKWSPEMISGRWNDKFPGESLSSSTIYRMIKSDWPELVKALPCRGKRYRARVIDRRGKVQQAAANKVDISHRPKSANKRTRIGDLEIDSILSKRGSKAAVINIVDRRVRNSWVIAVPNLKAETVRKALLIFLGGLKPYQRRSITFDRGSEFAEWEMIEKVFPDLKVYFCRAYAPHEKGSVERINREIRDFFPKKTDFALVNSEELKSAINIINNKPRKILKFKTPNEFYVEEIVREEDLLRMAA